MKGVSEVVVIVLILLIGVSVTAVLYIWASETAFNIYPEETQDVAYMRQRACLGIMSLTETEIVINNCGSVPLKSLKLYINGEFQNIVLPSQLDPWEEKTIFINLVNDDRVQVTSDYAYSPVITVITFTGPCGNNVIEGVEVCDGTDLAGLTNCMDFGYTNPGIISCKNDCSDYDTSGCLNDCGDGIVEPGEECDDGDLKDGDGCSSTCQLE